MSDEPTCAVWYWSHHSIHAAMFEEEEKAVRFTFSLEDNDEGAVSGVQFADGSFVGRHSWPAALKEERRRHERWNEEIRRERENPSPKPVTYSVSPPFACQGRTATVQGTVPSWLGAQDVDSRS